MEREQAPAGHAFENKPAVRIAGDAVTISFTAASYCDATVAIEDRRGQIVRHLACGVLGGNAPPPFRKNSLKQEIVWDSKDDRGKYIDDKADHVVRVSLGLEPRFQRTLFQSPYKRFGGASLLAVDKDGFYVYEAGGYETIRLYDRNGDYVRTVYPFPAARIDDVKILRRRYPDGAGIPAKRGYNLSTLLTGRPTGGVASARVIRSESSVLAVHEGTIALAGTRLNRMATDGSSGGLDLRGPEVYGSRPAARGSRIKRPHALAFSPDRKFLYLTAHTWMKHMGWCPFHQGFWSHAVLRMEFGSNEKPTVFLGKEGGRGKDDALFDHPADVRVDRAGRIYVADHVNNRVQVFDPDGKLLKSLPVEGPARLRFHHKTGELYVFSWFLGRTPGTAPDQKIEPRLRIFEPYPRLKLQATHVLPLRRYSTHTQRNSVVGQHYQVALDSWSNPARLLMVLDKGAYPELLELNRTGLKRIRSFEDDARRSGVPLREAANARQRLFVDPRNGTLYLAEGDCGTSKAFSHVVRIDTRTGRCRTVRLPFSASDMAVSIEGHAYLRTGSLVGRFDMATWREVPFDYGERRAASYSWDGHGTRLMGALKLPSTKTSPHWHHGGMDVNVKGDLLITCFNPSSIKAARKKRGVKKDVVEPAVAYRALLYPGRFMYGRELHIFDKHGHVKHRDLMKGQPEMVSGVGLDAECNVYANFAVSKMLDGKPYWKLVGHKFDQVGTLAKFKPGRGKFIKAHGTPVRLRSPPDRPMDLAGFWVEGAEWIYPGVGRTQWGMDCSCWNSRMTLDYFARSFAPEHDRFSVAVLDTNGNLIRRIGRYGNVDDGMPLSKTPDVPNPRSIGGDEVALFDGTYLATFTDRYLYVADPGNMRILSVKLGYRATETVSLRGVAGSE